MDALLADFISNASKLREFQNQKAELEKAKWTREYNKGPAFTLAEYARFWKISERTIRHYAKKNLIPGLFQVGKRLRVRKTKETFYCGLNLSRNKYTKLVKAFTSTKSDFILASAILKSNAVSFIHLRDAQEKNKILDIDELEKESSEVVKKRFEALNTINSFNHNIFDVIEKIIPNDPILKASDVELSFYFNHPEYANVLFIAACLDFNGIRPTRKRIAEIMDMSRATFSRKFPKIKWRVIKEGIAVILNSQ